ncbi:MAG: fluoride efflux transporter CrcB [Anaerolineae bacterium]|nr:fluoride efflux transporter CrcB [Anaerolineae bacterium]
MEQFLLISVGAVVGANLRYWVGDWVAQRLGASFPYGTLVVNLTGTLILGIFVTLAAERFLWDPRWRVLVAIGFCGSYTTFSSYMLESVSLISSGQYAIGLLNLFGSLVLGVTVMFAGIMIGRMI